MLDDLLERSGEAATITARPYVLKEGETFRWVVEIDGMAVPDADMQVYTDPNDGHVIVMTLVRGEEEVEIFRCRRKPARMSRPAWPAASATIGESTNSRYAAGFGK